MLAGHQSALLAFICAQLPGDSNVDDILQRTNLVIWKKRKDFEMGSSFKSWSFSIAHWEVRAHLKEKKRKGWLVIDDDLTQQLSMTMETVVEESPLSEMSLSLERCVQKLRPQDQELLHHHYFSDTPLKDYAESQGRPLTSLKTTLGRIRLALRKCLDSQSAVQSHTAQ